MKNFTFTWRCTACQKEESIDLHSISRNGDDISHYSPFPYGWTYLGQDGLFCPDEKLTIENGNVSYEIRTSDKLLADGVEWIP